MSILRFVPVMVLPALAYGLVTVLAGGANPEWTQREAFSIVMASGETWRVTFDTLFLAFALLCFFAELLRTALPTPASLWANLMLACAIVPSLLLFILVRGFGTNLFFLICLMMLLDFLLDSAILVFTSRRTVQIDRS